jgi:hypothetical protein
MITYRIADKPGVVPSQSRDERFPVTDQNNAASAA